MEDMHLVAIIKKPADKEELIAAIEFCNPVRVSVILYRENPRIKKGDVAEWLSGFNGVSFFEIDHKALTTAFLQDYLLQFEPYQTIALPIGNLRPLYKIIPYLRKRGKQIIHISDGVTDAFSLLSFSLALKGTGVLGILKAIYTYFEYKKAKGDYCFYQLYPLQSCLAYETKPVAKPELVKLPVEIEGLLKRNQVDTLLLPGWGESVESLLKIFPEVKNYCATTKERRIFINGNQIELNFFVTAEDIIKAGKVNTVVGTASSAVFFAKLFDREMHCKVVLNGSLNKYYGKYYEQIFRHKGEKIGIEFVKANSALSGKA